ncbi:MAG: hypothetical protein ACRYGP_05565 [Janthinobacterium lividum]
MIATALRAVAEDIEARATITTWDAHRQPTEEQKTVKADKIWAVAREVRALADDAERRSVRYAEFDALRGRLYVLGYELTPKLVENVAIAIRDAKGPVSALKRGWLNRP